MNNEFWDHLLITASAIEKVTELDVGQLEEISAHMESIDVLYHRSFDPADAYEEYVVVTLCRALNKALPRK